MKIIFLDVDGPLIPLRMHMQMGNGIFKYDEKGGYYVWDKNFIDNLNEHCPPQGIKLVWNSSHNDSGREVIRATAIANGLNPELFHEDICTGFPTSIVSRVKAIDDWLYKNTPKGQKCKWMVVDDYKLDLYQHQIRHSLEKGMTDALIMKLLSDMMHRQDIYYYNEAPTGQIRSENG